METKTVEISPNMIYAITIIAILAVAGLGYAFKLSSYIIVLAILLGVIALTGIFVACRKHCLNEMHCMMCGMTFGMIPAFVVGTIHALSTGDFVWPIITGTIAGAAIGIPFGMTGGQLGRMEAVMAAPMAGIMGAMTGVMVRIYNIDLFMIAFAAIVLFVMGETALMAHKASGKKLDFKGLGTSVVLALAILIPISVLAFPVGAGATDLQQLLQNGNSDDVNLPQINNGIQELSLQVQQLGYEPSVLNVKKGIPVKLDVTTVGQLGCQRGIVFRDFGINKVLQPGVSNIIEFTPDKEGQFLFSCPMGMIRGLLNVEA